MILSMTIPVCACVLPCVKQGLKNTTERSNEHCGDIANGDIQNASACAYTYAQIVECT